MRKNPHPGKEKEPKVLTRHFSAMDLVIQTSGHWMVPRERFSHVSQLFPPTATEQGALTILAHREVAQCLQHIKQYGNRYRVQHNRLQRAHHLEQQH